MKIVFKKNLKSIFLMTFLTMIVTLLISTPFLVAGELRLYTCYNLREYETWVPEAEKATGLKLKYAGGLSCNELWTRLQTEAPNFQADVVWSFMHHQALLAEKRGYLIPYKSPVWADIPNEFKDPNGYWHGDCYWFAALCINPEFAKKKNLPTPKSWVDLTNSVYKGEIVMPDPGTSGTAFLSISAVMQIFGEEKGWELFEKLDKNVGQFTSSGGKPADLVAHGEYPVGISWDGAIADREKKGYPIKMIIPTEGTAYSLNAIAILKGCKNIGGAKKLVDWLGTLEAQTLIGKTRSKVTRPGVESTVKLDPKLIKYDALWAGENQKRIMSEWRKRFPRR